MTDPHYDNPAGRLVGLLEAFRGQEPSTAAVDAWKTVLEANGDTEFIERYADMARLIATTTQDVRALPETEDPEFLSAGIQSLESLTVMLASARHQNVGQVCEVITETVLQNLKHCSRALRRSGDRTPVLPSEAVERLLKDVGEWISDVATDDALSVPAKKLLTRRLMDLQEALLTVRINGFGDVERAFGALVGSTVVEPSARSQSFFARCGDFWRTLVGMAEGTQQLASAMEGAVKAIETVSNVTGPN